MEQGWVKLYRKIEQNDFLMTDNNAFVVFTKLLMFTDKHVGAYRTATRVLAKRLNMPHSTVYKVLKRLEAEGMIHIEPRELYSKIWITNWSSYQSNREIDDILEHNAPLGGKRPEKRVLQSKKILQETVKGTQGKRTGNARETYNKKEKENNTNTNTSSYELGTAEPVRYGNADINEMFDFWEATVGYRISSQTKQNRNACSALIKSQGTESLKRFISWVNLAHADRFAKGEAKIADFIGLRANLKYLLVWAKGKAMEEQNGLPRF